VAVVIVKTEPETLALLPVVAVVEEQAVAQIPSSQALESMAPVVAVVAWVANATLLKSPLA
jgi:hypothetical protein